MHMAVMQAAAYEATIKQMQEMLKAGETKYSKLEQVHSVALLVDFSV